LHEETGTSAAPRQWRNRVVALTGVIGSGKSSVASRLAAHGAFCLEADRLARQAVEPGSAGLASIVRDFGDAVLRLDGKLDRARLAAIVFDDPVRRRRLEAITHPEIQRLAGDTFEAAFREKHPLYVYDCPLLFESGLDKCGFRSIVVVATSEEVCLDRVVERDGCTRDQAANRLAAQLPIAVKVARSDYVLENSGGLDDLDDAVANLFVRLVESQR
jgi:dephospho-CoA kinase